MHSKLFINSLSDNFQKGDLGAPGGKGSKGQAGEAGSAGPPGIPGGQGVPGPPVSNFCQCKLIYIYIDYKMILIDNIEHSIINQEISMD